MTMRIAMKTGRETERQRDRETERHRERGSHVDDKYGEVIEIKKSVVVVAAVVVVF